MRLAVIPFILFLFASSSFPATIHVPADYLTIQEAIDAAVAGDTVLVAPGTYVENIDFKGKAIMVKSSDGPEVTIVDGNQYGSVVVFQNRETLDSVLRGFTITNGTGTVVPPYSHIKGGGIYCVGSSPMICENIVTENHVDDWGGGICCDDQSFPVIKQNVLSNNEALNGGAIYCIYAAPDIIENSIIDNSVSGGGAGIYSISSDPIIMGNTMVGNLADYPTSNGSGGGILFWNSNTIIKHNIISNNFAGGGAGMMGLGSSTSTISCNIITANEANGNGGGIYLGTGTSTLSNNIITGNHAQEHGGGIHFILAGPSIVTNNAICGNTAGKQGGGIRSYDHESSTMTNTILWDNTAQIGPEMWIGSSSKCSVSYSDIEGGQASIYVAVNSKLKWGDGMMDADPLFIDALQSDYHILHTSPCRNAGDNSAASLPDEDFEGDPRVAGDTVDIGADEFYTHLYYTGDTAPGGTLDLNLIDTPMKEAVLFISNDVLDPPMMTLFGEWYLALPITHAVWLGQTPLNGLIQIDAWIPSQITVPYSIPLQAFAGDVLTNLCILEYSN